MRVGMLCAGLVMLLSACSGEKSSTVADLQATEVVFPNGTKIVAEYLTKDLDVMRGMMFVDKLAPDRGKLFRHPAESNYAYFMYQTRIPLDIIWISKQRRIVEIAPNTPACPSKSASACPSYGGHEKALYVLEVNAGIAAKNGLRVGDLLDF